eukprot:scpid96159/ scgid31414/ Ubiquitin-conjugating enzyme E2 D2B; Ubiquitin carrier protein D2B; Ubiquitin-conjugating enzyme E2(17)KB 2B; Ubiquitin-conjugating enzyme E2-17 kDa 2B; Ubiquitin-protein ligase D2B &gt; Ubiquitin-conjugating enzyme E2 D2B; Ubiquitin carrier protein D2B; Ubiquitin-protein ligase D2B
MADQRRLNLTDEQAMAMVFASLEEEARLLKRNPVPEFSAQPVTKDLLHWTGTILGPVGSPYEFGNFHLLIDFPKYYSSKWPTMVFKTKVLHPLRNKYGVICSVCVRNQIENTSFLTDYAILDILQSIRQIFGDPSSSCAHIHVAERTLNPGPGSYSQTAREWTKIYAT